MPSHASLLLTSALLLAPLSALRTAAQTTASTSQTTTTSAATASLSVYATMQVYTADIVDEPPQFPGGDRALLRYINNTRIYPAEAFRDRIQGRVLCSFVVMPDGVIVNANVVRGVERSLDAEALRIVSGMPRWHAGKVDGRIVPVYYVMPIIFRLQ